MKLTSYLFAVVAMVAGVACAHAKDALPSCDEFARLLSASAESSILRRSLQSHQLRGEESFANLDLDGDDINDVIIGGCPASIETGDVCILTVELTTGKKQVFSFDPNERFLLARVHSRVYAIVNHNKPGARSVIGFDKSGVRRLCNKL